MPKRIIIIYTDTGGGHKATALALKSALEREGDYQVLPVNVYEEVIPDLDLIRAMTPYDGEHVYNRFVLGKGWTGPFCLGFYAVVMLNIRLRWRKGVDRFSAYWRRFHPDLVISVMPLLNGMLHESLKGQNPENQRRETIPFMVVLTDYREPSRHVWFPPGGDYTIVCGTDRAYRDALAKPHPPERVRKTSGLVVNPAFYADAPVDIYLEREKLGLKAGIRTGCVLYGGAGSPRMVELARAVAEVPGEWQMIFLCGRDRAVAAELAGLNLPYPHVIRGYTRDVPDYMRLADLFVGKPGPGSITEALVTGLPLVLDCRRILFQERYNVTWIKERGVGMTFTSPRGFKDCLARLSEPAHLDAFRERVRRLRNRAVFEIPTIVKRLIERKPLVEAEWTGGEILEPAKPVDAAT